MSLAGMVAAAPGGIFMIPTLYAVFQWLREKGKRLLGGEVGGEKPAAPVEKVAE